MKLNDINDDESGHVNVLLLDHIAKQDNFSLKEKDDILNLVNF